MNHTGAGKTAKPELIIFVLTGPLSHWMPRQSHYSSSEEHQGGTTGLCCHFLWLLGGKNLFQRENKSFMCFNKIGYNGV